MILCFSGGIDSLAAYYFLNKPKTIYFDCSPYSSSEKEAVKELVPECMIDHSVNFTSRQVGTNAYVPHRNLILAALASTHDSIVVMAGLKDDMVEDKHPMAFNAMSAMLTSTSKSSVTVISPFWHMTKADVVKWMLENVPDAVELLMKTVSCYKGQRYCGSCPSCFRKANALWVNGIKLKFHDHFLFQNYYNKAINGQYDEDRCRSIIRFYNEHLKWSNE